MIVSDNGLRKIEGYEGWGRLLKEGPNAGCYIAYQDRYNGRLDKPTIGPGLTEDVTIGLVLTKDECSARFRRELASHEAAINKLVNVELSQNAFDAMVSLSYNVGAGAVAKSTVLRRLNKGDRHGAAQAFAYFNRAGGGIVDGLVQRRASEAALFLKPDAPPPAPAMPQTVTESPAPVSRTAVATTTAVTVATVVQTIPPGVPEAVTKSLENVHAWQGIGDQIWTLKAWAVAQPTLAGGLVVGVSAFWLWSKRKAAQ